MTHEKNVPARARELHVLVVDDSAVVRQVMSALLTEQPGMTVSVAADPYIAMQKMKERRPDVILLDLEMPKMDGMTFLRQIMKEDPIPVVVCSGLAASGTAAALRALEEGAVEVVAKPKLGVRDFLKESSLMLVDTIRAAAGARLGRISTPRSTEPRLTADVVLAPRRPGRTAHAGTTVVAIGASTGGTEALRELLRVMPPGAPGTVVVQHMPEQFTGAFAQRLDQVSRMNVREACDGDRIEPGNVLVAPGNRHIMVTRRVEGLAVEVRDGPLVARHRPSVDVLFRSVAQTVGGRAVGVLLTGMGDDGADGLMEMKQAGASTIVQDEATSVVFGMAKEAIRRGAVDEILPLFSIAKAILEKSDTAQRSQASDSGPRSGGARIP